MGFLEQFMAACMEESSCVCVAQRRKSREYQEVNQEQEEVLAAIQQKLGEDRRLMIRYEELENYKSALDWGWEWQEAFRECLALLRWMGAFA